MELLVSPAAGQPPAGAAGKSLASSVAASADKPDAAPDSLDAAHGSCSDLGELGDDAAAGPSLLDGLDALDPDYWDEAPASAANSARRRVGSSQPDSRPAQRSPDQPPRPSSHQQEPMQRSPALDDDDDIDDGGAMGLFDEDGGTEWDAPAPVAKLPANASSQRPPGKAKRGV